MNAADAQAGRAAVRAAMMNSARSRVTASSTISHGVALDSAGTGVGATGSGGDKGSLAIDGSIMGQA